MRKIAFSLILCLGGALLGCSSKPDVGDIEAELNQSWASCPLVKISNLKKTNGIDNGRVYSMAYSYTVEFLYSSNEVNAWSKNEMFKHCSLPHLFILIQEVRPFQFNKGDVITLTDEVDMVKSEEGWISQ